jgi:hypothetical protein
LNERRWFATGAAIVLAFVAALGGCGGGLVPVHGSVHCEGAVLSGGKVVFTPVGGGRPAWGEVQADGTFELMTERSSDGALPGKYRVRVMQSQDSGLGKVYTNYVAPSDNSLEIVRGQAKEIEINIRAQDGWTVSKDD